MAPKASRGSQAPLRVSQVRSTGQLAHVTDMVPVSSSFQLAKSDGAPKQVVHACGRTIAIPQAHKVEEILHLLQAELGMPDQIFEISDCHGRRVILDSDLSEACNAGRLPLNASLQDSAIHFIENRREELGQMQWKLVRDQHNQAQAKLNAFMLQIREMEASVEASKSSVERGLEHLRYELQRTTETTLEQAKAECRQIGERVSGVSQNLNAEKNMREVAIQQVNKAIQGVRDAIDSDRLQNQEALKLPITHISEVRRLVDRERSLRETAEDKHMFEMQSMRERMDEMAAQMKELMHEYGKRFEKASLDTTEALETNRKQAARARADTETFTSETNASMATLEDRCQMLEQRMQDAQERQSESLQRTNQRSEKFALAVEQSKFDAQDSKDSVAAVSTKVEEIVERIARTEENVNQVHERERQQRDVEMRNLRDHMISEYNKLLQTQENRLASRIEVEATQRQENVNQVLENVNAMLKKDGHSAVALEVRGPSLARSSSAMIPAPSPSMAAPTQALPRGGSISVAPLMPSSLMPRSTLTVPAASPMIVPVARSSVVTAGPGSPVARVHRATSGQAVSRFA